MIWLPYSCRQALTCGTAALSATMMVICVIMDAPGTAVSALSGKLGMLAGVSAKTVTAKV